MIRLEQVGKIYGDAEADDETVVAVDDVSLDVAEGETVCLIGPSGSGKTTLLKMINRLVEPTSGRILVEGRDVRDVDVIRLRRGIGYVIQSGGLFPHSSVADNVGLLGRLEGWSRSKTRGRAHDLLDLVGLPPAGYAARSPRELSGGEQQRVGIARALFLDPPVVLMDEPFGALDPITRSQLHDEFLQLEEKVRKTVVLVTHDLAEAFHLGDRVALLESGRLVQVGTEDDFQNHPAEDFVSDFVGSQLVRSQLGARSA